MTGLPYFSASSRVWDNPEWIFGIEEAGFSGWEIVSDGNFRLDDPVHRDRIAGVLASTSLNVTVHAPYSDLNPATLNYPIWEETVRQLCSCVSAAADFTDRITIHPGYLSPLCKMMPERAWAQQKEAIRQIGLCAADHGVLACLENMIAIKEFFCQDPDELLGMVEGLDGIGITIDFGHANTRGLVPQFAAIACRANHIHIHDNHGSSDVHLPLCRVTVPWRIVRDGLSK